MRMAAPGARCVKLRDALSSRCSVRAAHVKTRADHEHAQVAKERRRRIRAQPEPLLREVQDLSGRMEVVDPTLQSDDDGDLAHEFWRAITGGMFERSHG